MRIKRYFGYKFVSVVLIVTQLLIFTCDNFAFAATETTSSQTEPTTVPSGKELDGTEVKDLHSDALEGLGQLNSGAAAQPASAPKSVSTKQSASTMSAATTMAATTSSSGSGTSPIAANFNISAIKSFSQDPFSGAGTFSYPIAVPPGRKGIEPSLGLMYSSQGGNGICGIGWDMPLGVIERSTKHGSPKYSSDDTFILRSGGSSLELISIGGSEYKPKIEGAFMKFVFNGSYWVVTDKQGKKYTYGSQVNSQASSGAKIFGWYLERVEDLQGNYLVVAYSKDFNQPYAQEIKYTGFQNNEVFPSKIAFEYEDRADVIQNFRSSFEISTKKRLKNIIIQQEGALVRKYILNYTTSNMTSRSMLSSISQYYADNQPYLPPVSFSYSQKTDAPRWSLSSSWSIPVDAYFVASSDNRDIGIRLVDVNADGLVDLVRSYFYTNAYAGINYGFKQTFINNGQNGWVLTNDWVMPEYFVADRITSIADDAVRLFDVNGDGWPDYVFSVIGDDGAPPQATRLSNKTNGWVTDSPQWKLPAGVFFSRFTNWGNWPSPVLYLGLVLCDVNGDGMLDVVKAYGTDRQTYLNNGNGWTRTTAWDMLDGDLSNGTTTFAEINGDGLIDFVISQGATKKVYLNNGAGWSLASNWVIPADVDISAGDCQFIDVNSDGLSDIVKAPASGEKKVYLNTSQGWVYDAAYSSFPGRLTDLGTRTEDINADGVIDVMTTYNNSAQVYLGAGPYPDLLKTVNNGIGGTVDVSYRSYKGADNTVGAEKSDLPFPLQVVSDVHYNDGMGNSYPVHYQYDKAKFSFQDREFRGFGYVKTTDVDGNQSETWFNQDDIFKGRPYRQKTSDAQGHLFTMSESTWQSVVLYPGVNFPYVATTNNYIYDGDDTYKQTRTTAEYDSLGNPTKIRNEGDVSVAGDEKEVDSEYVKNDQLWLIGLPSHVTSRDSAGNVISEKWIYYDNSDQGNAVPQLGQMTKESAWLFNPLTAVSSTLSSTYGYDVYGNLISSTDPLGHSSSTQYDTNYNIFPVKVTNALNQSVESTYDPSTGAVLTTKDPNGQVTTNVYDVVGRLSKVIGPNDTVDTPSTTYQYDLSACPIKMAKQNKFNDTPEYYTSYSFSDGLGRGIQTRAPGENDPVTHIARQIVDGAVVFDSKGQVKEKYLPYYEPVSSQYVAPNISGPHASFSYDCLGRLIQTINADTTTSSTTFSDWIVTSTDENNHSKTSYRDAFGNIVKVEEHNQGQTYTTTYEYDAQNNLAKITDNQGNVTQVWYDSFGHKLKMNDPDMGTWLYEYDAVGNLKGQTDNKGQVLQFFYDTLNRLTSKQANGQTLVSYVYDDLNKANCRGRLSYITDLSGRTDFYYDNLGREIKSEKTIGSTTYSVQRTYDVLDRLVRLTYPDSSVVQYSYNPQGVEKVEEINPSTGVTTKTYVSNINYLPTGQMSRVEYGNSTFTDYQYDPLTLRLANLKTNNGSIQNLSYQFDAVGNIKKISDDAYGAVQNFQYDDLDRLASAAGTHYGTLNYAYDSIGNLLATGSSTLTYAGANAGPRPHAVTAASSADGVINFDYDENGNMKSRSNPTTGEVLTYSYDSENRLIKVEPSVQTQDDSVNVTLNLTPGWNFISVPFTPANAAIPQVLSSLAFGIDYDQVSRLNPATGLFEHYASAPGYDQFNTMEFGRGYEIFVKNPAGCTLALNGTANKQQTSIALKQGTNLIGYSYSTAKTVAEVFKSLNQNIDYSAVKVYNIQSGWIALSQEDLMEPGRAYEISALKDCSLIVEPSIAVPLTTNFVYDGDGGRVRKTTDDGRGTINTTTYIGSLYEVSGDVAKKHIFAGSNRICTVNWQTGQPANRITDYFHGDHLGSSNVITNDSGSVVQHLEYKPYGESALNEPSGGQSGDSTNYKFTGKELDDSTGLYFYGARYYDPTLGRFASPDTIVQAPYDPQSLNRYAYCRNNPLNYIDPTGHSWKSFWKKVGDFFSGIGKAIAENPGAFIAGILVGLLTSWAIGPMISSFSSACAATGSGITFGEGFLIGGMELGIPAFTGTLAGGLVGGESFGTAIKNAGIVGGITFVTAGLIEGSYAEGWQDKWHFNDTRAAEVKHYNDLRADGNFQAADAYKASIYSKHIRLNQGFAGVHTGLQIRDDLGDLRGNWGFNPSDKDNPLIKAKVLAGKTVSGKVYTAVEGETYNSVRYMSNDISFIQRVHQAIQVSMNNPPSYNLYIKDGGIRCDEWVKRMIEHAVNK